MVSFIISYTFGRVRKVSHFLPPPPPFRTVSVDGRRFEGCWIDGGGCCITIFEIRLGQRSVLITWNLVSLPFDERFEVREVDIG